MRVWSNPWPREGDTTTPEQFNETSVASRKREEKKGHNKDRNSIFFKIKVEIFMYLHNNS